MSHGSKWKYWCDILNIFSEICFHNKGLVARVAIHYLESSHTYNVRSSKYWLSYHAQMLQKIISLSSLKHSRFSHGHLTEFRSLMLMSCDQFFACHFNHQRAKEADIATRPKGRNLQHKLPQKRTTITHY